MMSNISGIDDYNQSVWSKLGHSAFNDYEQMLNDDIEWWDIHEEKEE